MSYSKLEDRVRQKLQELEMAGLRRELREPAGIDLSSNDYLKLSQHPLVKQRMAAAALHEGCGSTGSRLLRGQHKLFANIEQRFAAFKQTEASLYFGSGYAANIGVLATFIERHDLVFSDALNHASIIDGLRLSNARRMKFAHRNLDQLSRLLRAAPRETQKFLITESLFSMDGDFAPLDDYATLCEETGTTLIVDEAHAVGIYGARGSGCIEDSGVGEQVFLSINTAGKALGVCGAFVAGPQWAMDYMVNRCRTFIFSTATPPPVAAALDASLELMKSEPQLRHLLLQRSAMLRGLLADSGFDIQPCRSQIIPIVLGDNARACSVAAELQREGFDVRALRPPTVPDGTARLRVTVNVGLDEASMRAFASSLGRLCFAVCS